MPLSPSQWQRTLTQESLRPAYLLVGDELLVLEAADALRAQAKHLGYTERDVLDAGARFDWDELARAAASMSLFASRRVIDLRLPTGRPGTEGAKAITAFCIDPPPDVTLLITATEWSNRHEGAWTKTLDKAGVVVVFNAPRQHEWASWIAARLASRGLKATAEAAALLAGRVEGNLLAAAQEIDKLAMLRGQVPGRIEVDEMERLVADSARYDAFKLTDAAFAGDGARALHVLAGLRAEGDELIPLMGWLVSQLQLALRLANAHDFAAQAKIERLWQAREQLFRQALRRAPREHWLACLARAGRIDRIAKGREQGDAWRETERLIAVIAQPLAAGALA